MLCEAIITLACEDYMSLMEKEEKWTGTRQSGCFSVDEIEQFLCGNWCECLLSSIDSPVNGESLLYQMKINARQNKKLDVQSIDDIIKEKREMVS